MWPLIALLIVGFFVGAVYYSVRGTKNTPGFEIRKQYKGPIKVEPDTLSYEETRVRDQALNALTRSRKVSAELKKLYRKHDLHDSIAAVTEETRGFTEKVRAFMLSNRSLSDAEIIELEKNTINLNKHTGEQEESVKHFHTY
jgi:hypothetical protein